MSDRFIAKAIRHMTDTVIERAPLFANRSSLRVLVSGGSGFIGSNVVHGLNSRGITDITIVDRLGSGAKWRNLVGLRYAEYLEVDAFRKRRDQTSCDFDVVIAMGACSSTRESDASYLMSNNVGDMVELAQWSLAGCNHRGEGLFKSRPTRARFIYASSAATYGLSDHQSDSLSPTECRPVNKYALSKNMVDQALEARGLLSQVVGLKYFNLFGPNSAHKGVMTDFVAKTFDQIRTVGYATLYDTHASTPDGVKDQRDFLYIKDAVDMTLFFALDERGKQANGLFNIGSSAPASWTEVAAHTLIAAIGYKADVRTEDYIRYQPMPSDLRAQYQYYTCADISKLRAAGYSASITPLDAAIRDYVTQYLVPDRRRGEVS